MRDDLLTGEGRVTVGESARGSGRNGSHDSALGMCRTLTVIPCDIARTLVDSNE